MKSEKLEKELQEQGVKNCATCGNSYGPSNVFECAGCTPENFEKWVERTK